MSRQESFELFYADQHGITAEGMSQYRWAEKDGYRLPGISAAYRNFCAGWDSRALLADADIEARDLQDLADAARAEYFESEERP